ncbi:MAG: FAD-dependent thymidylate synthase [Candidatus Caldarchaeum sp.]
MSILSVMVELKIYSYGPRTVINFSGSELEVGPDVFIALEGAGTFEGVSVERRVSKLLAEGRDLARTARKVHRESTRRGHASITTSLHLQMEVMNCSRALSLLLVSPPFGSYLQESQRRARVDRSMLVEPLGLTGEAKDVFMQTAYKMVDEYLSLVGGDVGIEDARYILPLCTKTSLFISCSLENYVALIQLCGDESAAAYVPDEVREFVEKFTSAVRNVAPIMLESRLGFRNRTAAYPFPNPYKPSDIFMEKVIEANNHPEEPVLISFASLLGKEADLLKILAKQDKESLDSVNPMTTATTLEPLSLVAYHQAIRHRTVPTAVESIYTAAWRAVVNTTSGVVIPPSIRRNEKTKSRFLQVVCEALQSYRQLLDIGISPSTAVLIVPQALKVYAVRLYNGFNILHPSGFIATRSCSYAQWEERAIAYKLMQEIARKSPSLSAVMGEKCRHLGYCPEREWCPIILKYHQYSDELHKRFGESG